MSTAEIPRELLEIEELRQKIETELAKRHNWAAQEKFWEHEARMGRTRNYIAVTAIAATLASALTAVLARFL